ncbi:MAG TPA: LysM peptidoglycan-binding domain-containing protein [Phycisphaerales bacterium]|nr:LysM peptidoglycan-binding domain-containing protein [Phycisphaerales bacterium]
MHRDFKIGMAVGLVCVGGMVVWITTRPSLSARNLAGRAAESRISTTPDRPIQPPPGQTSRTPPTQTTTPSSTAQPPAQTPVRTHIVRNNETLSQIATQYYGSPTKWRQIFDANRDVVKNPDSVKPGTRLVIP